MKLITWLVIGGITLLFILGMSDGLPTGDNVTVMEAVFGGGGANAK